MLTLWAVTAAATALGAAAAFRSAAAARVAQKARAERFLAEARADLASAALVRGAAGALRIAPSGAVLACGDVPGAVRAACAAGATGDLGAAVARLLGEGRTFRQTISTPEGPCAVAGTLEGGHPTLFVERLASAFPAGAENGLPARLGDLLAAVPHPAWLAAEDGECLWANPAYARALGAEGAALPDAAAEPLLDANARSRLSCATDGGVARDRVQTVVAGERRHLDVTAIERDGVLAALAVDVTEATLALTTQRRALESHAATFDRLATAVAIYGPDRRLAFHNAAFQTLWGLSPAFLEQAPKEEEVLDRLRAERRLPETADFRAWKRDQLTGYETREGFERWWHLPDGQTLRVIANPGPDGGVTYIYENVTEQLALERRYNALSRVQAETIDNLGEGVASFGPDGLLRLANPAFWTLTGAPPAEVGDHVREIAEGVPPEALPTWEALAERVTGLTDHRTELTGRLERADGRVLDYAFSPLPDGSTLATFADVTDSVNVARALVERNVALVEADRLKNAFIEHVSYELRSPLNTIIGFTQLLIRPETGLLSEKQREYATYISASSEALLVIIDGILDLATIDAGIMELTIEPIDVEATVGQVLDGLKDRIAEGGLAIRTEIAPNARAFEADAQRVRQILFNLLSNAVAHSPQGGAITIRARSDGAFVALSVRDEGPGIAEDRAEAVFERFHTAAGPGGKRGGVGLGLSLVKGFVELHGGTVAVAPVEGPGAELVVRLPMRQAGREEEKRAA